MQTDFGKGVSTCTMEGVIAQLDPEIRVYDSTHDITPFDTYEASYDLFYVVAFWPRGTIFVSVVDPGVGTSRRACVAKLKNGCYVVTPDNGTLSHMVKYIGVEEVREIDEVRNRYPSTLACSIFHGRDLFAYCAGKFASGLISYEEVGPRYPVEEIVIHSTVEALAKEGMATGMLETADRHFGLICSNISQKAFAAAGFSYGDRVMTVIRHDKEIVYQEVIPFVKSFGFVQKGQVLIMVSETLEMQIARSYGNIYEEYHFGTGPDWTISFTKESL